MTSQDFIKLEISFFKKGTMFFKYYVHDPNMSLKDFWLNLYKVSDRHCTHYKKTPNEVYTTTGRYRSLIDIFLLSRYYYPKVRLMDICKIIVEETFGSHYCSTIHRLCIYPIGARRGSTGGGFQQATAEFGQFLGKDIFDFVIKENSIKPREFTIESIKKMRKNYLEKGTLYFKDYHLEKSLTLEDFYLKMWGLMKIYDTYESVNNTKVDYNTQNYRASRERSIGEIFRICYHYYKCNLKDLLIVIMDKDPRGQERAGDINSLVISPYSTGITGYTDYFCYKMVEYDKFSFSEMMQFIKTLKDKKKQEVIA